MIGSGYTSIACCLYSSFAIKSDKTLWAWGNNEYGQLGDGTNMGKNAPVKVGSDYAMISCGGFHSLALKTDNTLWAWGINSFAELADGTRIDRNTPVQIP
jgi:alpha-tubulin suppressor-like RCC1 family protein